MDYPIVYDKFENTFSGLGIAILENAKSVRVRKVINGELKLYLILPRNDPKWKHIQAENFIRVKGQNYRIRTFEEIRDKQGKLLSNIQCEHVWYDANDCKYIPKIEMIGASPRSILEAAFSGTRFMVGSVEISTLTDIMLSKTNPAKITQELIKLVGGELIRDNWTVHLVSMIGSAKGVQIRIGKNLDTIKKTTDSSGLVTRLFPYGKDDLDITSVNSGVDYLDSQYIGNYDYIHQSPKDYKDIEDPTELKIKALAEFSTYEKDGIDKPRVTYEAPVIELKKLTEYGNLEAFDEGDTITAIDEDLNINVNARIMEYEEYPFEAQRSTTVLANFRDNLGNFLADLERSKQYLEAITDNRGNIKAAWLENIVAMLQTEINAALGTKKIVMHDQGDLWVDNIENPSKAMAIVDGMFAVANSKKENGDWNWRTIGTADRFVADEVDARWVYAGSVTASQIDIIPDDKIMSASTWNGKVDPSYNKFTHIDPYGIYTGTLTAEQINAIQGISLGLGASINWNYVNKPAYTATDVGARPYDWLPEYGQLLGTKPPYDADNTYAAIGSQRLTYIDQYGVYTGVLTAQQINAIQGITLGAGASINWAYVNKPGYIAAEVGALPASTYIPSTPDITQIAANYVATPNLVTNIGTVANSLNLGSLDIPGSLYFQNWSSIYSDSPGGLPRLHYSANEHVFEQGSVWFAANAGVTSVNFSGVGVNFDNCNVSGLNVIARFA